MTTERHRKDTKVEMPRLQKTQLCLDGKRRRDCVCVVDTSGPMGHEKRCGKPMVGVIPWMNDRGFRLCEEHYELFVQNAIARQVGDW